MKKVALISLGCAKNLVDSENILGLLNFDQYKIVKTVEESDIVIINTCGFIEPSKKESIDTILEVCSLNKKVVVTGCLVQRYVNELKKEIPEVDLWIPIKDYYRFNELLQSIDEELYAAGGVDDHLRTISTGSFSAYLKIGEGCDNRCSYCAIPLIRGGFVSRDINDIINEAKELAYRGYKELIVLQQDTTKYGIDLPYKTNIVELLKELLKIESLEFIRLLYLYPDEITDELIDLIISNKKLTPYFDIPIQHSEDSILTSMNRRGNKEFLKTLFNKIRNKNPKAILRTTIMVGFPGESDDDFNNLIDFIKEIQFDHLGCFSYSREENTPSYNFPNQISEEVKQKRVNELMKVQQSISYRRNKTHLDEEMEGIVVGKDNDYYLLRSYFNAPDDIDGKVLFKSPVELKEGDIVKVKITHAFVYDLMGELVQ